MVNSPLIDRLILRFQPNFLYRGKLLQNIADISVSMLHLASPKDHAWKFMDYLTLQKASILRYQGTVKQLKMLGELDPKSPIFEIVKANSDRPVNQGDIVLLDHQTLSALVDAPTA